MNKYVVKETFRMETLKDVRNVVRPYHWGATVNLKDAYYHISISKECRKYLRFVLDGEV